MKTIICFTLSLFISISLIAGGFNNNLSSKSTQKISDAIEKVRSELNDNSGMSITVVNKDKILYSNVYGYSDIGTKTKVTADTPFYIASTTKSLIASLILILESEGLLDIDAPIKEYLPESFQFEDPNLSTKWITIRDLISHRTGIQNQVIEIRTTFTGQQNNETLLKLFSKSRYAGRKHNYSNLNYILLGIIIDNATGKSWKDLLSEKLFKPLGMANSTSYFDLSDYKKIAKPHSFNLDNTISSKLKNEMTIQTNTLLPSGGIFSTSKDLGSYMQMILNKGRFNGTQILSENKISAALANQANIKRNFPYSFFSYGLGWEIADYEGNTLATHNGSNRIGYKSYMAVLLEEGVGISILSNENVVPFFSQVIVANYVLNLALGKSDADTILEKEIKQYKVKLEDRINKRLKMMPGSGKMPEGLPISKMILPAGSFTGKYKNPIWGEFEIKVNGDQLHFQFGNLNSNGVMIEENQFKVNFGFAIATVSFIIEDNKVKSFKVREIGAEFSKEYN